MDHEILLLGENDMARLALPAESLLEAVRAAFEDRARGDVAMPAKSDLHLESGSFFHAMPAAMPQKGAAAVKWVGGAPGNARRGLPHIAATLLLSDADTGALRAIVAANRLTGLRTAAVSLLGARHLARGNSRCIGLVGCGLQARLHLDLFRESFPIERAIVIGRTLDGAERFAREARGRGLEARASDDPDDLLGQSDIVVSSVPARPALRAFLDAGKVKSGAFASLVDLGRSWLPASLRHFAAIHTDDLEQSSELAARGRLPQEASFVADLAALVTGRAPGRRDAHERLALLHPGTALADLAVAGLAVEAAEAQGLGRRVAL